MKTLNTAVKVLAITLTIMLISAIFLPDKSTLKTTSKSKLTPAQLYSYLSDIEFWKSWSPMFKVDSTIKLTQHESSAVSWKGEQVGQGTLSIEKSKQDELVRIKITFAEPVEMENNDKWLLTLSGDSTEIYWESIGSLSYPMGRIYGVFLEKHQQENIEGAMK